MKSIRDIKDLTPSEVFLEHSKNFASSKGFFLNIYKDYPNKEKIITLLDYWIFNIFILKEIYGSEGLIAFCDNNVDNPQRFSFLYEFSDPVIGKSLNKQGNSAAQFISLFLNKIFIPGATLNGFISKLLNRISIYYINSIPLKEDSNTKSKIFKLIDEMMAECLSVKEIDKIKSKLPKIFYAEVVSTPYKKEVLVEGSCASFLEFSGKENLFLLDRKLRVLGFQHGGGYDIFQIDYFAEYEKRLSDLFFGWGFSEHNKPQKKFKKRYRSKNINNNQGRILWIEDSSLPSFYFGSMPHHHYSSINKETKSYIYRELNKENLKYSSLFHPSSKSNFYDEFRRDDYLLSGKGSSEDLINLHDILIFDNPGSTLLHFAIENSIIFYQIISREDFNHFTPMQKEFFLMLKKNDFGFFNDERGKMLDSMLKITSNNNYSLPSELLEFYKKFF